MPNFSSLARLEVPEKFLWWVGGVGGVCKVIFVSNPTVVLCCVGVGVLTTMMCKTIPTLCNTRIVYLLKVCLLASAIRNRFILQTSMIHCCMEAFMVPGDP